MHFEGPCKGCVCVNKYSGAALFCQVVKLLLVQCTCRAFGTCGAVNHVSFGVFCEPCIYRSNSL